MGMLQSRLNECLTWYSCLANEIAVHKNQAGFDATLSASSLCKHDRQLQQMRREALYQARCTLWHGAALAKQRNAGKRSYANMHSLDRKILDDFDSGKSKKAKQALTQPRLKPFRCKMPFND